MRSRTPSFSAWMIRGSVGSRGSPMPKSMTSRPCARRASAASFSRTDGYVAWPRRIGEMGTERTLPGEETPQCLVAMDEGRDLDLLVATVGERRIAGPKVHGVDPTRGEVGDVRPRLLRLEREIAGGEQRLHERGVRDDPRWWRVADDLHVDALG